jgi:FAD:protein FMN transferase
MQQSRLVMGMPATVEVVGATEDAFASVFELWENIDARFSTYKNDSEVSRFNRGELAQSEASDAFLEVLALCDRTKEESGGYFDARRPDGSLDPSGVVKGWAIKRAAQLLDAEGERDFYLEIGGDIQVRGHDAAGQDWRIGIRNPFDRTEVVKVLYPRGAGIATSGSAARGAHIYNPHDPADLLSDIVSATVIGPDVCEADRFATAVFAMGHKGIEFIETLLGFEGYQIDAQGIATMTSGLGQYLS